MYLQETLTGQQQITRDDQVKNNAGGFVFAIEQWTQLDRWFILGSEKGTYYVDQKKHTMQNVGVLQKCITDDGERVVARIVELSLAGRAPKQDQLIYALAACVASKDIKTKIAAFAAMPKVLRTASFLEQFVSYAKPQRGMGMGFRKALLRTMFSFRGNTPADALAYQAVKYANRYGWSLRDLLRLCKPNIKKFDQIETTGEVDVITRPIAREMFDATLAFIARGEVKEGAPKIIPAYVATRGENPDLDLVLATQLPHDAWPTQWKTQYSAWESILPTMPLGALIRNLATMTKVGVFQRPSSIRIVAERLNQESIRRARIHPINILTAWLTYKSGHSTRGDATWNPIADIIRMLERAFYLAFGNIDPAGTRQLIGLDVSGSMGSPNLMGVPGLTPRLASAALCLMQAATESSLEVIGFTESYYGSAGIAQLPIDREGGLEKFLRTLSNLPFGGTDCALPMLYAQGQGKSIDTFIIYTDNETWAGAVHPYKALQDYRAYAKIDAKLIVVGMTATGFSIADPHDAGMLDVVGFDSIVPQLIANFARPNLAATPLALTTDEE